MKDAAHIFRFAMDAQARGERVALVTLTGVVGSSSRAIGTHMAVSESGEHAGSFSGGCVEAAIVGEALRVIESGRTATLRLGSGSPFLDIRLPCGGGIDIVMTPDIPAAHFRRAVDRLGARLPLSLAISPDAGMAIIDGDVVDGWSDGSFFVRHDPKLRLVIIGHGDETVALVRLAGAYGADVQVLSPDDAVLKACTLAGAEAYRLKTPSPSADLVVDQHSAVVFLFHDHDWEGALLAQALDLRPFYIGAMGSPATHARRIEQLADQGLSPADLTRVRGPIGLIPATRDPDTLALSIIAEIVSVYQRFCANQGMIDMAATTNAENARLIHELPA